MDRHKEVSRWARSCSRHGSIARSSFLVECRRGLRRVTLHARRTARKEDGLTWVRSDLAGDGVHPSDSGRRKVADLLLEFFTTDPLAKGWFPNADKD